MMTLVAVEIPDAVCPLPRPRHKCKMDGIVKRVAVAVLLFALLGGIAWYVITAMTPVIVVSDIDSIWHSTALPPEWAKVAPEQIAEAKKHGVPVAFENDLGMRFVLIPAGTFLMGSPADEEDREADEGPRHEVTLASFYLATTETTQAVWKAALEENPSEDQGDSFPVTNVSWDDCQRFVERLNKTIPAGGYRLPTEAEWEYACRAGDLTRFCSGDAEADLSGVGWYDTNSDDRLHAVGAKSANGWGLRDLHGNVAEWCQDAWRDSYTDAPVDGSASEVRGTGNRVFRGGSWEDDYWYTRSAARDGNPSDRSFRRIGFRLVSPLPEPKSGK